MYVCVYTILTNNKQYITFIMHLIKTLLYSIYNALFVNYAKIQITYQ